MAPLRIAFRLGALSWTLTQALLDFWWLRLQAPGSVPARERAQWLHRWCRTGLRRLGIDTTTEGAAPCGGLLVSNHLSYLDILVFSATTPCVFVSKQEVGGWPIFGWLSHMAGTIFVDRSRPSQTAAAQEEIENRLASGLLVVLFPEGTSSDGSCVLPFRSALFESAIAAGAATSAAHIRYETSSGRPETDVCYWGKMTLALHVLKLFSIEHITAHLQFSGRAHRFLNRKAAAREMYLEVLQLAEVNGLARAV